MNQNSKSQAVSTLFSLVLTKYLNLDVTTSITLTSVLGILVTDGFDFTFLSQLGTFNYTYLYIIFPILLIYYFIFKSKSSKPEVEEDKYVKLSIYYKSDIQTFIWYIETYPEYFDKYFNVDIANPQYEIDGGDCHDCLPQANCKMYFNDTKFNVKGYFICNLISVEEGRDKDNKPIMKNNFSIVIHLEKGSLNCIEYFKAIENLKKQSNTKLMLYSVKIFGSVSEVHHCIYDGNIYTKEEGYKRYIEPYFSPNKDRLWKTFEMIQYEPDRIISLGQTPYFNMLAYGPPGSGKSTFAYRIAMALGRHIVNIDLSSALTLGRNTMYQIFQKPIINNTIYPPNKCVFMIEEIDYAIATLDKKKEEPKWFDPRFFPGYSDFKIENSGRGQDEKNSGRGQDEKKEKARSNDFELSDLLELFQGPIPRNGGIVIATTNNIDLIRKKIPELIRPGRLTPILFDYLDYDTLQQISKFYFKQELDIPHFEKLTTHTSDIIENAIYFHLTNDFLSFSKFVSAKVDSCLSSSTSPFSSSSSRLSAESSPRSFNLDCPD